MLPVLASRRNRAGRAIELIAYSEAVSSGSDIIFLIITMLALVLGSSSTHDKQKTFHWERTSAVGFQFHADERLVGHGLAGVPEDQFQTG